MKDLTARFDMSQPAVSHYRVDPRRMKPLLDWIAPYRACWPERVDRLERLLERMEG